MTMDREGTEGDLEDGGEGVGVIPSSSLRLRHVVELNPTKSEVRGLSGNTLVAFLPMEALSNLGNVDVSTLKHRCTTRSTLLTSQLPLEHWHEYLADPTLADAILDRLVHAAYKLTLRGESLRKRTAPLTEETLTP